jgi:hypothetical protein
MLRQGTDRQICTQNPPKFNFATSKPQPSARRGERRLRHEHTTILEDLQGLSTYVLGAVRNYFVRSVYLAVLGRHTH